MLGAQRGAALTQRMLAFARKQELTLQGVDVSALVRDMTGLLQRTLGPGIEVTTRFPPNLPPALTDANQLEIALLNLAVNARDAMPDGGKIAIEASEETLETLSEVGLPAGRYVRLAVRDQGVGMDEATIARAVEPFFTTKGVGKGTGLGLPMVHGLAEQSGGRLKLYSRPGRGTRIEIWLPQTDSVGPRETPCAGSARLNGESVRGLTVLAVDDDSLVLDNTAAMLEDLGHHVLVASSGAEALALLADNPVDLVITDYAMPQMNGLQLARDIEALRPGLLIALATGYAELPPGAGAGIPRLAKPYSQAELARLLAELAPAQVPA
jgi:CheY-like chemotaxis protein/two-component sensor histidine kinase